MTASDEAVVRRFYEEMNNSRKNELAEELFTADQVMHDPQVPAGRGPQGVVEVVRTYQEAVDGHWAIEELFSSGDRVSCAAPALEPTLARSTASRPLARPSTSMPASIGCRTAKSRRPGRSGHARVLATDRRCREKVRSCRQFSG